MDRGNGQGFVLLTYDTTPNYEDTQPFPATPTKWTYRASPGWTTIRSDNGAIR